MINMIKFTCISLIYRLPKLHKWQELVFPVCMEGQKHFRGRNTLGQDIMVDEMVYSAKSGAKGDEKHPDSDPIKNRQMEGSMGSTENKLIHQIAQSNCTKGHNRGQGYKGTGVRGHKTERESTDIYYSWAPSVDDPPILWITYRAIALKHSYWAIPHTGSQEHK